MQYLYFLLTTAVQSAGQLFALFLGWMIAFYFGKMPTTQRYLLSAIAGVSLIWAAMTTSITFPWFREALTSLRGQSVPFYIKLLVPLAGIGWLTLPLINSILAAIYKRKSGMPASKLSFLDGYKYSIGFAIAFILMAISIPLDLLKGFSRGFRREHLTIMIKSGEFNSVLVGIVSLLSQNGYKIEVVSGKLWRRSPEQLLAFFAHDLIGDWSKNTARVIAGEGFRISVFPTDIVIEGISHIVIKVRNRIGKELTFLEAYFTWNGDAHRIEEKINVVRREYIPDQAKYSLRRLDEIELELENAVIPYEEWGVLLRQILQLRTKLLCASEI